jgi:hypothetical protein
MISRKSVIRFPPDSTRRLYELIRSGVPPALAFKTVRFEPSVTRIKAKGY